MKKLSVPVMACLALLAGCHQAAAPSGATASLGKVGVILPDAVSSVRWESGDRRYLKAAFEAQGIEADIQNAGGVVAKFQSLAD
ncbi:MAG: xylose binding protein transport system, partial [Caulobacteraceae bacterium]|nr:xylose binding protein transport system [Caulobacteraceae bacterium]